MMLGHAGCHHAADSSTASSSPGNPANRIVELALEPEEAVESCAANPSQAERHHQGRRRVGRGHVGRRSRGRPWTLCHRPTPHTTSEVGPRFVEPSGRDQLGGADGTAPECPKAFTHPQRWPLDHRFPPSIPRLSPAVGVVRPSAGHVANHVTGQLVVVTGADSHLLGPGTRALILATSFTGLTLILLHSCVAIGAGGPASKGPSRPLHLRSGGSPFQPKKLHGRFCSSSAA
jgi:hypothetical protein